MTDDEKSPAEKAVELIVYAPVGFFNFMKSMLPGWIEGGRQEVTKQVATAKALTEFAVASGKQDAEKRVAQVGEVVTNLSRRNGASRIPAPAPAPKAAAPTPAPAPSGAAAESNGPRPTSDGLAIPGYDSLAASQVVERLGGLSGAELEAVRAYEQAARGRRTILNKIGQLQTEKS